MGKNKNVIASAVVRSLFGDRDHLRLLNSQ